MLTEEYLKDHFITAHFCDNERQNIEILMTNEDKSATIPYVIPFDEKDVKFQALQTVMTVDQLHEATYQQKKQQRTCQKRIYFLREMTSIRIKT